MNTYLTQISKLCDDVPVVITRARIESYMSKVDEEGIWFVSTPSQLPQIAGFTLICMPGCCGVVISTNCWVQMGYQRRGLGTLLNQMRIQMAWELGYSVMMCTDSASNAPQQRILVKNGWNRVRSFENQRTGNYVHVEDIIVRDTGIPLGFSI